MKYVQYQLSAYSNLVSMFSGHAVNIINIVIHLYFALLFNADCKEKNSSMPSAFKFSISMKWVKKCEKPILN